MIDTAGGIAEVVDIAPRNKRRGAGVVCACMGMHTSFEPALKTLVNEGRRTISLNHRDVAAK